MKTKLLFLILFCQLTFSYGQNIVIDQITPTETGGGINVNLLVTTLNGAGYLNNSYTITGNTIDLSVCYWFNLTLPVYQIETDIFIPVTNPGNYTINVSIFHSSSTTACDFYAVGPTSTVSILSNEVFESRAHLFKLYPNPTNGKVEYSGIHDSINNITIVDQMGRLVKTIRDSEIDLSDIDNGLYFVRFETENTIFTSQIIVEK